MVCLIMSFKMTPWFTFKQWLSSGICKHQEFRNADNELRVLESLYIESFPHWMLGCSMLQSFIHFWHCAHPSALESNHKIWSVLVHCSVKSWTYGRPVNYTLHSECDFDFDALMSVRIDPTKQSAIKNLTQPSANDLNRSMLSYAIHQRVQTYDRGRNFISTSEISWEC